MSAFVERVLQLFGKNTPEHIIRASVTNGIPTFHVEMSPLKNPVVVRYAPGTQIRIDPDEQYRPFGEEEVIFAKDIQFFGAGISNGRTTDGRYFKALGDPSEITPLVIIKGKTSK